MIDPLSVYARIDRFCWLHMRYQDESTLDIGVLDSTVDGYSNRLYNDTSEKLVSTGSVAIGVGASLAPTMLVCLIRSRMYCRWDRRSTSGVGSRQIGGKTKWRRDPCSVYLLSKSWPLILLTNVPISSKGLNTNHRGSGSSRITSILSIGNLCSPDFDSPIFSPVCMLLGYHRGFWEWNQIIEMDEVEFLNQYQNEVVKFAMKLSILW